MRILTKHRLERDVYAVDFSADLAPGETITSGTVTVLKRRGDGTWEDVTAEFRVGEPAPVPDSAAVRVLFWLKVAAAGAQTPDSAPQLATRSPEIPLHALLVSATTSAAATLVAMDAEARLPRLVVNGEGP